MEKLKDYSGKFKPDLKFEDFSSDVLARLWQMTSRCFVLLEGHWFGQVRKRYGEKLAIEMSTELWKPLALHEARQMREVLNIHGDDVATVLKTFQCLPDSVGTMEMEFELKNKNHGIATYRRCKPLEYSEKVGDPLLLEYGCEIDCWALPLLAHDVNPKIKVTNLKLPPRKSPDEPACQWEVKLEE